MNIDSNDNNNYKAYKDQYIEDNTDNYLLPSNINKINNKYNFNNYNNYKSIFIDNHKQDTSNNHNIIQTSNYNIPDYTNTLSMVIEPKSNNPERSYVYLDINIDGNSIGRIKFELFNDIVPRTAKNFYYLCSGQRVAKRYDNNFNLKKGNFIHLKNCKFHKIIKGKIAVSGDITRGDGRGGCSIWEEDFADENFKVKHFKAGLLSMANRGPDTNNSQFFITLDNTFWYDDKHVVFGQMIEGKNVLEAIENAGSDFSDERYGSSSNYTSGGIPKKKVIIENCGVIT